MLIISGNLSFLNWLTILPSLACFDDASIAWMFSKSTVNKVLKIQTEENEGRAPKLKVGEFLLSIKKFRLLKKYVNTYISTRSDIATVCFV